MYYFIYLIYSHFAIVTIPRKHKQLIQLFHSFGASTSWDLIYYVLTLKLIPSFTLQYIKLHPARQFYFISLISENKTRSILRYRIDSSYWYVCV
jgi:hypothetical protein